MKIKILAAVGIIAALAVAVFLNSLTDGVTREEDPTERAVIMAKDTYNQYGLEDRRALSDTPLTEFEGIVCYNDRVFRRFEYSGYNIVNIRNAVDNIKSLGGIENVYVVPVPPRVLTEKGYEADADEYGRYIDDLTEEMGNAAHVVNVWPELSEHTEEYLFFRTDEAWTARGAYYGSSVLCEELGIEPYPLDEYNEYQYRKFEGNIADEISALYKAANGTDSITEAVDSIPQDPIFYYILPGSVNIETCIKDDGSRQQSPIISQSRVGLAAFIGGWFTQAILYGDQKDEKVKDKNILVICDNKGKLVTPFIANYYDRVYVVKIDRYEEFSQRLRDIVGEYDIGDVVLIQQASNIGNVDENIAIRNLMY